MRHARSEKNQHSQYGGEGKALIPDAYTELAVVMPSLILAKIEFVVCAPRLQCEQTADYIALKLAIKYRVDTLLEPIYLGVIDGLSEKEISSKYPDVAKIFKQWQGGKIEIGELRIPDIEAPNVYCQRMASFIENIFHDHHNSVLIVATRSTLVCLGNLLLGNSPHPGGNYREISWHNNGYMYFRIDGRKFSFIRDLSTVLPLKSDMQNCREE